MVWVTSPELGVHEPKLTLDTLIQHSILAHARQTSPFRQLAKLVWDESDARLVPSTNHSACMRMTLEGLGVASPPQAMVQDELDSGGLVQLRCLWVPDDLSFMAHFQTDKSTHHVRQAADLAGQMAAGHF